jgi:hypothetical protein
MLVFLTQLCELLPLYSNPISCSPPPTLPKVKVQAFHVFFYFCLDKFNRRAPACEREDTDDLLWQQGGPPYHHSSSTHQCFAKTEDLLTIRRSIEEC